MTKDPRKQQVRLVDNTVWTVANLASPAGQRVLKRLKDEVGPGKPVAYCTCQDSQPAEFVAPSRATLTLRTFPRQAHKHAPTCYFAPHVNALSGQSGDADPVVVERNNLLHIRFTTGVQIRGNAEPATTSPVSPGSFAGGGEILR